MYVRSLCLMVVFMMLNRLGAIGEGVVMAQNPRNESLIGFIGSIANDLQCYVTIEQFSDPRSRRFSVFKTAHVCIGERPDSIEELLVALRKELPTVTVLRNKDNGQIVHLIEGGLEGEDGYALDQRVSIDFRGPLGSGAADRGLVDELERRVPGIEAQRGAIIGELFDDTVTDVSVKAKDEVVREVLTKAVPLEHYSHFLWQAETEKKDGKLTTIVHFFGPDPDWWEKTGKDEYAKKRMK